MKIEIDLNEASTLRGAVWLIGSLIALFFIMFSTEEHAMAVMTITGMVAGGLGVGVSDGTK
jgi:hypothetical protein